MSTDRAADRVAEPSTGGSTALAALVAGCREYARTSVLLALVALLPAYLVGALAGVFLVRTARDADARLVAAGARPASVLLARFGLLAVVGAAVAVATAATTHVPERPLVVGVAALLAAPVYGLLGLLAGLVVDRLAGVYLALFGTMLDVFLVQNPLAATPDYASLLLGHAPVELAVDAGFPADVAPATAAAALACLLVVGAAAALALSRGLRAA